MPFHRDDQTNEYRTNRTTGDSNFRRDGDMRENTSESQQGQNYYVAKAPNVTSYIEGSYSDYARPQNSHERNYTSQHDRNYQERRGEEESGPLYSYSVDDMPHRAGTVTMNEEQGVLPVSTDENYSNRSQSGHNKCHPRVRYGS
ncbi:unnamed protein product [Trichobilharzia szidati]|nr:unnamed protein product [Trichobilharzia szidati]